MPYKNPGRDRDYHAEYLNLKADPKAKERKLDRQRARRKLDAEGIDRTGKDIDHKRPLSKGGSATARDNLRLVSPSVNRAFSQVKGRTVKNARPGSRKV